jgi:hypothetical protein
MGNGLGVAAALGKLKFSGPRTELMDAFMILVVLELDGGSRYALATSSKIRK